MVRPATLLTLARRVIREASLLARGDRVLCACSGGPDSMALLHVLSLLRKQLGHELVAVGVDHGLRPEASAELELARALAAEQGVPFEVAAVEVEPGGDLQARARRLRHGALQACAAKLGARVIALGHTADDRAETFVMRLLRGAGPRGLAVMPARAEGIEASPAVALVRPLIAARRSDVVAHLGRHGVSSAQDPSNDDPRFLRTRVRSEVLPMLESLSPGIVAHLCALAEMLDGAADDPLAGLPRAQRLALQKALRAGRSGVAVRLSGGRDVELNFFRATPDKVPRT